MLSDLDPARGITDAAFAWFFFDRRRTAAAGWLDRFSYNELISSFRLCRYTSKSCRSSGLFEVNSSTP